MSSMNEPSASKAQESLDIAIREGMKGLVGSSVVVAASHFVLSHFSPTYVKIPEPPKRILAAVIILGTFAFQSHMQQALHVKNSNIEAARNMRKLK